MKGLLLLLLLAGPAAAAVDYADGKKDIAAVAVEHARRWPDDAGRALKAGENQLRRLRERYQAAGSTPPATMDADMAALAAAVALVRVARSRGRRPPPDPRAARVLGRLWEGYRARWGQLKEDVPYKRGAGASETKIYWEALKDFDALAADTLEAAAYNPPPDEENAESVVAGDRGELLKLLEDPARVQGLPACVKTPGEGTLPDSFDIGPFYRAAGLLPGTNPLRKFAFSLPPGCRSVTQREDGVRLILRAGKGQGRAFVGAAENPMTYEYVFVPPQASYIVENRGAGPLDVEGIALQP